MQTKSVILQGKWSGCTIEVVRRLGAGANGEVFLVRYNGRLCAMKANQSSGNLALEWSVLEQLGRTTSCFPKPILIDDCEIPPRFFYLMEWVDGQSLDLMLQQPHPLELQLVMISILNALKELHQTNHAFCDVKPENILIEQVQGKKNVRLVDVGGVTSFGHSVRQFTPYYDRAFWGLGTRISDEHYDLCAVVLMFLCLSAHPPVRLAEEGIRERAAWLQCTLQNFPRSSYIHPFQMVLSTKITNAQVFIERITQNNTSDGQQFVRPKIRKVVGQTHDWTERTMWYSLCFAACATFIAWGSFFGWF